MGGRETGDSGFNDILTALKGTSVLAVYQNSYYAGTAALTENKVGNGRVLHLGSTFSRQNVRRLLEYTGVCEPFSHIIDAPEEVELVMRTKGEKSFLFALNYHPAPLRLN